MSLTIGWFTSGEDTKNNELFANTYKAIQELNLDITISFLFNNHQQGENKATDQFLAFTKDLGINLITLSSEEFRENFISSQPGGDSSADWQEEYHHQVMEKISQYPIDLAFLVGYTPKVSIEFVRKYQTIKFRPAPPVGPSGDRQTIIWQLIGTRALRSGATLDFLTEGDPERGIPLAYCDYFIRSEEFLPRWRDFDRKMKSLSMKQIMDTEGENNALYKAIRETGEKWEQPLLTLTIQYLSTGVMSIKEQQVYLKNDVQPDGCRLTKDIGKKFFNIEDEEDEEDNEEDTSEKTEDTAFE